MKQKNKKTDYSLYCYSLVQMWCGYSMKKHKNIGKMLEILPFCTWNHFLTIIFGQKSNDSKEQQVTLDLVVWLDHNLFLKTTLSPLNFAKQCVGISKRWARWGKAELKIVYCFTGEARNWIVILPTFRKCFHFSVMDFDHYFKKDGSLVSWFPFFMFSSGFLLFFRGFINYARIRKMADTFSTLPRTRVLFIY